jgi:HD-GYP domain-containing protein (c-di-GMP phosphodiesterase class II)
LNQDQMQITEVEAPPNLYQGYMYFSLSVLVPGSSAPCAIHLEAYNQNLGRVRLVQAISSGDTIREEWLSRLLREGVGQAYINLDDLPALQAYLHERIEELLEEDLEQANRMVYENALCAIKSAMLDPKNGRRLAMAAAAVREMIQHLWVNEKARKDMLKVMTTSQELFTHSVNVCLLGIGLAITLGWERDQVEDLGLALFFHDLGLAEESAKAEGYRPVCAEGEAGHRDHPDESANYLTDMPGANPTILEAVRSHHENLDGTGFPRGLEGYSVSSAARLLRVVDLYELATSGCLKPESLSPFSALQLMRYEMRDQLDQEIVGAFVLFLGQT